MGQPAPSPAAPSPARAAARGGNASWVLLLVAALGCSAYAAAATFYLRSVPIRVTARGLRAGGQDIGGVEFAGLAERLRAIGEPGLDEPLLLTIGDARARTTRREAGFVVDVSAVVAAAEAVGRSGNPLRDLPARRRALRGQMDLPIRFALDTDKALEFVTDLKELVDRAPVAAKLDLEHHTVAAERAGQLLQAYESLVPLEAAARGAATRAAGPIRVALPVVVVPARVKKEDFAGIDIGVVLASWETHYSTLAIDSDRTYNLKVGAGKLDGHVLKPHELFSFNEVLGDRTEREGYRVAPVISSGELIDGLAGGMCQIASTLHAASLFAGLDIVSSTPHSRPSAYIPMGLDATVVYPSTDLKIKNPFDFPVVMHFSVNQGAVKVELLGQRRVYRTVFEREILEEHAFPVEARRDRETRKGQKFVAQEGYPGYRAIRRRYLFDAAGELPRNLGPPSAPLQKLADAGRVTPVRVDKWTIHYPATAQINVVGSGPASLKKRDPPPSHHIPAVAADQKPFGRIVR